MEPPEAGFDTNRCYNLGMKIRDVYERFGIPENLQEHMLRVTKIAMMIANGWRGDGLDKEIIVRAGLVHDLANIVRFKLDEGSDLKVRQKETIERYGDNDHAATEKMLRELGMDEALIEIVQGKSFGNAIEIGKGDNWPLKILFYSDMRVVPSGVVDLETRLTDIVTRLDKYRNHPKREQLLESAREVGKQIQGRTSIRLEDITDRVVSEDLKVLLETEV